MVKWVLISVSMPIEVSGVRVIKGSLIIKAMLTVSEALMELADLRGRQVFKGEGPLIVRAFTYFPSLFMHEETLVRAHS